ncbi:integrase [Streptomyces sp. NPDC096354]|uniref:integrase n=1 Tax=Streptomyces sp. NPDC096354 TaxID=3366088 RepID=UPI0037F2C868
MLLRRRAAKDTEFLVLQHENAVLRKQLSKTVLYEPADRLWFAAGSSLILQRRWARVVPVTPATLLACHQRLIARTWDCNKRRSRTSRPPTAGAAKALVLQANTPLACAGVRGAGRAIAGRVPRPG